MGTKSKAVIWNEEVEKFKKACHKLGRVIKVTELSHHFMGLKCYSWYADNAPVDLHIKTYTDFLKYLGEDVFYIERPTKEFVINYIKNLHSKLGRNVKMSDFKNSKTIQKKDIDYYFGGINKMNRALGFAESGSFRGYIYSKEELITLLKNFVDENGFVPTSNFVENHGKEYGLPNRKTYSNKFGSWKNVLHECGFDKELADKNFVLNDDGKYVLQHNNENFLKNLVLEYIDKFNKIPTVKNISEYYGSDLHSNYVTYCGGFNTCLESLGLDLNIKTQYTQDELDYHFKKFVNEYSRTPTIRDFNKTGRPSFWVYQQKYGSWAETCIHYGLKPNCRKPEYYMDDGERCDSSYEYDISMWLKAHNIPYDRDMPYIDFTDNYNGKMNCDYKLYIRNEIWYVEMAGFVKSLNFSDTTSDEERMYLRKLNYKIKLFNMNNIKNYKIIFRKDMQEKSLDEIFEFIFSVKKEAV